MGRQMRWWMVLGVGELTLLSQSITHESYVIGVMAEVIIYGHWMSHVFLEWFGVVIGWTAVDQRVESNMLVVEISATNSGSG